MRITKAKSSGGVAEAWIYGDAPFLKQPFGDVAPVSVSLAPSTQLNRAGVCVLRESQVPHLHFELGRERRAGPKGLPPIGIAATARHDGESGWYRHSSDDTPAGCTLQFEFSHHDANRCHNREIAPYNGAARNFGGRSGSQILRGVGMEKERGARLFSCLRSWLGGSAGCGKLIAPLPRAFELRRRSHAGLVRTLASAARKLACSLG